MSGLDIKEKLTRFSSLKIRQLINELEKMYERNRDKKAKTLVFVQRRFSAKVLYHVLKIYFSQTEDADLILPDFMVGSNGSMPESIEQILSAKKDRRVSSLYKQLSTLSNSRWKQAHIRFFFLLYRWIMYIFRQMLTIWIG